MKLIVGITVDVGEGPDAVGDPGVVERDGRIDTVDCKLFVKDKDLVADANFEEVTDFDTVIGSLGVINPVGLGDQEKDADGIADFEAETEALFEIANDNV